MSVPAGEHALGAGPDERLISLSADGVPRYPHTDRRGSTIAVARLGVAQERFAYGPHGETVGSPAGYPWRYTGQRLDDWTGLYNYKAREYSPNLGRFLQPDPAGFVDGPNLYDYVGGDPVGRTDPSGLQADLRLFGGSDATSLIRAQMYLEMKSYYSIVGHSVGPNHFLEGNIAPKVVRGNGTLRSMMTGYKANMPVFIGICNFGKGGVNSAAAQLSAQSGIGTVLAADGYVQYSFNALGMGVTFVTQQFDPVSPRGKFVEYSDGRPTGRTASIVVTRERSFGLDWFTKGSRETVIKWDRPEASPPPPPPPKK